LEHIAIDLLERYAPETLGWDPVPTPIEKIIEIDCGLYMCYMNLSEDGQTLGKTCFDDGYTQVYNRIKKKMEYIRVDRGTIIIEADLLDDNPGRLRFTQGHEFSHWIMHRHIYAGTQRQLALREQKPDPEEKWIEWQANEVSRNLLLPMQTVRPYFYYLKHHYGYNESRIIANIAERYTVSKHAVAIQLRKNCFIK